MNYHHKEMDKTVRTKKLSIEEIFRIARDPEALEKLLLEHGYITRRGLLEADKFVKGRIKLLERLR